MAAYIITKHNNEILSMVGIVCYCYSTVHRPLLLLSTFPLKNNLIVPGILSGRQHFIIQHGTFFAPTGIISLNHLHYMKGFTYIISSKPLCDRYYYSIIQMRKTRPGGLSSFFKATQQVVEPGFSLGPASSPGRYPLACTAL